MKTHFVPAKMTATFSPADLRKLVEEYANAHVENPWVVDTVELDALPQGNTYRIEAHVTFRDRREPVLERDDGQNPT